MPDVSPFIPAPDKIACGSAIENLGVIRACSAAHTAFLAAVAEDKPNYIAESEGAEAYRRAMPPLDTEENIRNFISCVAHATPCLSGSSIPPKLPPPLRRPVRRRHPKQTFQQAPPAVKCNQAIWDRVTV